MAPTHPAALRTPPCSPTHPTPQPYAPHPLPRASQERDAFGLEPAQRAFECWLLTRAPRYLDVIRLVLAVRFTRTAVGVAPPLRLVTYVHTSGDPPPEPPPDASPKRVSIFAKPKDLTPALPPGAPPATGVSDVGVQPLPPLLFGFPLGREPAAVAAQLMLELLRLPASGPGGMRPGMTAEQTEDLLTLQRDLVEHCITPSLQAAGSVLAPAADGSRPPSPKRSPSPRSAQPKKGTKLPPGRPGSAAATAGAASSAPPAAATAAATAAGHRAFCTALFEARSPDGSTLLMAAAAQGALTLVTQLLDVLSASAPPAAAAAATAVNKRGEGALHCAALGGHLDMISLLLSRTPLRLTGERALDVAGRGPLDLCSAIDRTLLQQLHLPNMDGSLLDEITFPLQDECPEVIFSYASRTDGEKGTAWMWMLAGLLREAGITSYNARQTPVGGDWLKEWFGRMPDCKICVAMFSPAYFESDKCKDELYEAAESQL